MSYEFLNFVRFLSYAYTYICMHFNNRFNPLSRIKTHSEESRKIKQWGGL